MALSAFLSLLAPHIGWWSPTPAGEAFDGLLRLDPFAEIARGILLGFLLLYIPFTRLTGIPDSDDAADFYTLIFGALLGMLLMTSASHLLTLFLAIEMASLPCYALAGFLKGRRTGGEAAMKYVIIGAAAAGSMLYGISLITAATGSGRLDLVARTTALALTGQSSALLATGWTLVAVGIAFKLGVIPVQFWLPDVFEGAAAEVGAFLSTASKAATVTLAARLLVAIANQTDSALLLQKFAPAVALLAALTVTFGNLAAFPQTNLKRLFAYSTIAHAGLMTMALATASRDGAAALLYYSAAYALANLGVFFTIAIVRNQTGSETIDACRGLFHRSPWTGGAFAICVMSLLGLPPLAGFAGKFQIFASLFEASRQTSGTVSREFQVLLGVAVLNTALSAGYYLRLLKFVVLDEPTENAAPLGEKCSAKALLAVIALMTLILGIIQGPLTNAAYEAVAQLP